MKPNAEEFHGPPIYCESESCDFTAMSVRGLRRSNYVCPKCNSKLMMRTVLPPGFGDKDLLFCLSCLDCANFEHGSGCTGFGGRCEGHCRVFFAPPCSADTICEAIDFDLEEKAAELVKFLGKLPKAFVEKCFETWNKNNRDVK